MKLFIVTDFYAEEYGDKFYYLSNFSSILRRYYEKFGKVILCARKRKLVKLSNAYEDVTDFIDNFIEIKNLEGTFLYRDNKKMAQAIEESDLVIARCPSIIAYRAADLARKMGKPYYAESMGCAWDAYWNHGIVGKAIAPYMFFKMKKVVYKADYGLYVTREFLQKRYPCKNKTIAASNVKIQVPSSDTLIKRFDKIEHMDHANISLMTTGAVDVRYKGHEYVLKAIPELNKMGIRVQYRIVGGGDQSFLRELSQKYKIEDQVFFTGRIPPEEVFSLAMDTDIYIQPSLQEGLPRAVIEAMSRGCICVGARTAGIPELIDQEFVVRRKSSKDIVDTIKTISGMNTSELQKIAERNYEEAKSYYPDLLDKIRNDYYEEIITGIGSRA